MANLVLGKQADGTPFELPRDSVAWLMAILAKRGAGKSYTAGVLMEELLKAKLPFACLDPVGIAWGLLSSADGLSESPYPVIVFGGSHAHIPIERDLGASVASMIFEHNLQAVVIDLTLLSKSAWRIFVRDFCRELYRRHREAKQVRHIILEEADEFIPQRLRPDMAEVYEAVERMFSLGRNFGLGGTIVSRRSAQVAKDVLTQVDVLFAMRTVGLQDRKAVLSTIEESLEEDQRQSYEQMRKDLPSLPNGTGWAFAPEQKMLTKVAFRERETFHAGATPGVDEEAIVAVEALPDVAALRATFEELIAAAEDPDAPAPKAKRRKSKPVAACDHDAELAELKAETERLTVKVDEVDDARVALETEKDELAGELELSREDAARFQQVRSLLGANGAVSAEGAVVDEEAIIRRVVAQVGSGGTTVTLAPAEALRARYLERGADRMLVRVEALSQDAREAFEFLVGQQKFVGINSMSKALSGNDAGSIRERWKKAMKEAVDAGAVRTGGTGGNQFKADVEAGARAELATHSPTDDDISAVVDRVLRGIAAVA